MALAKIVAFFGAVIAWDTLSVQLVVIPFCRKAETLYKDYVAAGVLDAALSHIETHRLIPALANMFSRARDKQPDRRMRFDMEELLQEVDYIRDLETAQEAMNEKNALTGLLDRLQTSARSIWKWGLFHVLVMLMIPIWHWIFDANLWSVGVTVLGFFAFLALAVAAIGLLRFDRQEKEFLDLLKRNR